MARTITGHEANDFNRRLRVVATDMRADPGGAHHLYRIEAVPGDGTGRMVEPVDIPFQKGVVPEAGINGITEESLLAILIDRLKSFQAGPFSCRENATALTHIETALLWLNHRTRDRISREVEGTHEV